MQPPPWPPQWLIQLVGIGALCALVVILSGIVALVVHVILAIVNR